MMNIDARPSVWECHLGRVAEQRHLVDPADAAFASLAVDHPDRCSTDADYPGWNPHSAHTLRAMRRNPLRPRQHRMTAGDLKALLANVPDWAVVEIVTYDELELPEEHDPCVEYSAGVLSIEAAS